MIKPRKTANPKKKVKKNKKCSRNAQKHKKKALSSKENPHPERGDAHINIYKILQVLATRQLNIFQVTRVDHRKEISPKSRGP